MENHLLLGCGGKCRENSKKKDLHLNLLIYGKKSESNQQKDQFAPEIPNIWPLSLGPYNTRAVLSCTPIYVLYKIYPSINWAKRCHVDLTIEYLNVVCASVFCNAESASSNYQSCPTHLEAGLEFLQVPDGDHHLVQALLDLGEGGMGGWIFEKVET